MLFTLTFRDIIEIRDHEKLPCSVTFEIKDNFIIIILFILVLQKKCGTFLIVMIKKAVGKFDICSILRKLKYVYADFVPFIG